MTQVSQRKTQSAPRADRLRFALQMAQQARKVGERIQELRTERRWSRPEFARRLEGVSTGNDVYRWERGAHMPRTSTLEAIAETLGTTVGDLHEGPMADREPKDGVPDPWAEELDYELDYTKIAISDRHWLEQRLDQLEAGLERIETIILDLQDREPAEAPASPGEILERIGEAGEDAEADEEAGAQHG